MITQALGNMLRICEKWNLLTFATSLVNVLNKKVNDILHPADVNCLTKAQYVIENPRWLWKPSMATNVYVKSLIAAQRPLEYRSAIATLFQFICSCLTTKIEVIL